MPRSPRARIPSSAMFIATSRAAPESEGVPEEPLVALPPLSWAIRSSVLAEPSAAAGSDGSGTGSGTGDGGSISGSGSGAGGVGSRRRLRDGVRGRLGDRRRRRLRDHDRARHLGARPARPERPDASTQVVRLREQPLDGGAGLLHPLARLGARRGDDPLRLGAGAREQTLGLGPHVAQQLVGPEARLGPQLLRHRLGLRDHGPDPLGRAVGDRRPGRGLRPVRHRPEMLAHLVGVPALANRLKVVPEYLLSLHAGECNGARFVTSPVSP